MMDKKGPSVCPLVTVVTLTYKKFDHIYETLESVLRQNYAKIQYIIADDGSPNFPEDDIQSYLESHKSDNLISYSILTREHNVGTVKNFNHAYRAAEGEVILPLSAEDVFVDTSVVTKIAKRFEQEQCDVLCTSRIMTDEYLKPICYLPYIHNRKRIERMHSAFDQRKAFLLDEFFDMASGSVTYMRKSFLETWGYFDERFVLWEDGPFYLNYTSKGKKIHFAYDIVSIYYRLGGVSNSGVNPLMRQDQILFNDLYRQNGTGLSYFERRMIHYIRQRYLLTDPLKVYGLYMKNPDIMLLKLWKRLRANVIYRREKKIIKNRCEDKNAGS